MATIYAKNKITGKFEKIGPAANATDSTLTLQGSPADAKATGDAINDIQTQINDITNNNDNTKSTFVQISDTKPTDTETKIWINTSEEWNDNIADSMVLYTAQTLTEAQKAQARENIGALAKNQGTANVGKILVVGVDGNLTLTDMPSGTSGDVIGMIDANNNIVITGNLADGTYVFKYENTNGTYADIGSLVVGGVVEYSITANLTNCIGASGNAKVIEENGAVTLTFTANDGYVLPENVTVSGAGYTWNATTGKLVLSNPTADVVITIVATKSGYTNIIDTVGYKDNTRLSSSDGTERTGATGYVTTGMITLSPGDVLRTKGVNYTNATYNLAFAHRFNASTGAYVAAYKDSSGGVGSASDTMTNDGSGNLTIHNGSTTAFNLRLVGYGSGADLIVTINEEITD